MCLPNNIPSKFENIISRCDLIRSGPPAVYYLKPKKQEFGTLTRMTVGEKNPNKINKTILFVGETGAGKSSLINALVNYAIGVKWEDKVWFQMVEDENKFQTESQTLDMIVYEIFGFEDETLPYSLSIIDTPGYGGTRGIKHDDKISQRLLDLFKSEDGVHEVHVIGLVMKASDNRMSDQPMYVFNSVMSLFEKDLEKNIVALITHSNGRIPKSALKALEAAEIKCAKNGEKPVHFLFDNCQNEDRTEEEEFLTGAYKISEKGIRDFTTFLKNSEPQKLEKTVEVLNKQHRLTACIQNLDKIIKQSELKQADINQIQEDVRKHEEEVKKNENFIVEVDEHYKEKNAISGFSFWNSNEFICSVCEENCGNKKIWNLTQSEIMKDGHCTVCTNKCPVSHHVKEKRRYVMKTRKVMKTMDKIKEKYEENKSECKKKLSILENLEKEMIQLTAEKSQFLDESYQHIVSLEQIALKAYSVATFVHLDFLIERMKEEGATEKVQKLEEMRSRVDEGTRAALRYKECVKNR